MATEDEYGSFINNLGKYKEALEQEYEAATQADDVDAIRKQLEKKLAQALPGFVDDLIMIARMGDTDSSRLKAIQFAFNWYFSNDSVTADPFSKLLEELTNTTKESKNAV
jgi:hypothetical protein